MLFLAGRDQHTIRPYLLNQPYAMAFVVEILATTV